VRARSLIPALLLALLMPIAHAQALKYAGVNLAGAEFNASRRPGTLYKDYVYPTAGDFAYFAGQGMNTIRLPFLWERLQPQAMGVLDTTQLGLIKKAVSQAKANSQYIILDVHNYAKYNGTRIGSDEVTAATLADLWQRLAIEFGNDEAVIFGLMNEPNAIPAADWAVAAQASIDAIRAAGASNLILVPGTAWTGAHSWASSYYGGSNAQALAAIRDPANRFAFEVHQYLDSDYSGTSGECVGPTIGVDKLRGFTAWLREQGKTGFLAEFGGGANETCNQAVENMLAHIEQNGDVWLGWTWWAAGAWWKPDYPFNVHPDKDGSAKPQMGILAPAARRITD
jgi:endoglucanase